MTLLQEPPTASTGDVEEPVSPQPLPDATDVTSEQGPVNAVPPLLAGGAAFLATAAAAWMVTGVFVGSTARIVGVGAALLGAAMFVLATKSTRPALVQTAALPVAAVVGAVLVAPDATGGTANLPRLVIEALKTGGLSSPPIPFDPGWRFLLTILVSSLAMAAASLAHGLGRPRLSVVLPAPIAGVAVLVQPPGRELVSVGVSLVLLIAALAVAFGADLADQGTTGRMFEARRFGRAGATLLLLLAVLAGVSQFGFLFPETDDSEVIPPRRPEPPPASPDRVLFTVRADLAVPWRLGVLDVYEDNAWLTPPFDPRRFEVIGPSGAVPGADAPPADTGTFKATFEIQDVEGRSVPDIAGAVEVVDAPSGTEVDPRTGSLRLPARARRGTTYTVRASMPPSSTALYDAARVAPAQAPFLAAPEPPDAVRQLLSEMPPGLPLYERLQFVRTRYYENVVAAGEGNPVDLPPERVAEMLTGKEGTPYEIAAGEALLARWAGVPARVGYGYFGGDLKEGYVEVRPRHGAMWLEVHFEGAGWTPIVGRPPRARSSLTDNDKVADPTVRPTEELAALVHVPVRVSRLTLVYRLVQYWAMRLVPLAVVLLLGATFYPGLVKALRAIRRRRWAVRNGPHAQVAVAYAEFRDSAIDLNLGHPTLTPLEFVWVTEDDAEHRHLAWLVTRALWGDLNRDLRSEDVERAEQWSRSVRRRLGAAQPLVARLLGVASRASLIDPYDSAVPNLWWRTSLRAKAGRAMRRAARGLRTSALRSIERARASVRRRAWSSAAVLLLAAVSLFTGCSRDVDLARLGPAAVESLPAVPGELGAFRFELEPKADAAFAKLADVSLVSVLRLYAIRDKDGVVVGTLQLAAFKHGLGERDDVRDGLVGSVVGGRLRRQRLGRHVVYAARLPEQRVLLELTPDGAAYQLLVASTSLANPDQLFVDLLAQQRGEASVALSEIGAAEPVDPRRGGP